MRTLRILIFFLLLNIKGWSQCTTDVTNSILPNPSFEQYTQCPRMFSEFLASDWCQGTNEGTPDYYNTSCPPYIPSSYPWWYQNVQPIPDGQGFVGMVQGDYNYAFDPTHDVNNGFTSWREYIATCLLQPFVAGTTYNFSFYVTSRMSQGDGSLCTGTIAPNLPLRFVLYGRPTCPIGVFPDQCTQPVSYLDACLRTPPWIEIGSVSYTPTTNNPWIQLTITFTPSVNIRAIEFGVECVLTDDYNIYLDYCWAYMLFDNFQVTQSSCSDNNSCTTDACINNSCIHTSINCNDNNACTTDGCNPQSGCTHTQINCSDINPCTIDICNAGVCSHVLRNCNDNNACTTDNCIAGNCVNTIINCNDNNRCTNDGCVNGNCVHINVLCNDNNPCTDDACIR